MNYTLATFWYERNRFIPGIVAVAFSSLLILFQGGVLVGQFSLMSTPIDHAQADLWVGHPQNLSVDLGRPIPVSWISYVAAQQEVQHVEPYIIGLIVMDRLDGQSELCTVIGSSLEHDSVGAIQELTPALRSQLSEPGAVVADESELTRLGFTGSGDFAEVMGERVRLVGTVKGLKSLAAPYLFCSLETARNLFRGIQADQTVFLLARCRAPGQAEAVANRLRSQHGFSAYSRAEFSTRSRIHWITATKAGLTTAWSALLGLIIGIVVTSQTLYSATASSWREYAVLEALGIPTWRLVRAVLSLSFWVGATGILLGLLVTFLLGDLLNSLNIKVLFPWWLVGASCAFTLSTALISGLLALRSLRLAQPAQLLR